MENQNNGRILAMYDIRGIQDYIFRTSKVKDAIGASAIVEDIIYDAITDAVAKAEAGEKSITNDLKWYDQNGVRTYNNEEPKDVQVLYIGGGNAFFTFCDRALCLEINKFMSKYIIDSTYSLQLAIAMTDYTGNYQQDYVGIFQEMNMVKERMVLSQPLKPLPIMKIDVATGYPLQYTGGNNSEETVMEVLEKKHKEKEMRSSLNKDEKVFDNLVTEKGIDSTLAVVHIDGNNMGLRIRNQIRGITDYGTAVMAMRRISYRINHSYKKVFAQMKQHFDAAEKTRRNREQSVLKILVAGDDITYVCNGAIAIDTVEYFAREISNYTLDGEKQDSRQEGSYEYPLETENRRERLQSMGFSVCAGIAFIHSHFPFSVGYEVAEACCESAKCRAKKESYRGFSNEGQACKKDRIGNWLDFHICKNVQARNLEDMRRRKYVTNHQENLLLRPYFIPTATDFGLEKQVEEVLMLNSFKKAIAVFTENGKDSMPRSFAKRLRNTYPQGEAQVQLLYDFLQSRGWKLSEDLYTEIEGTKYARYYDALEMMDYYSPSEEDIHGKGNAENE